MPRLKAYTIHDKRVEEHFPPFFAPTDQHAIRSFRTAYMSEGENPIKLWPRDFDLKCIGEFDSDEGVIHPHGAKLLVNAETFTVQEPANG